MLENNHDGIIQVLSLSRSKGKMQLLTQAVYIARPKRVLHYLDLAKHHDESLKWTKVLHGMCFGGALDFNILATYRIQR